MTETKLKIKVLKWLRNEYPNGWFYKTCDRFTVGIPDIIGCIRGRFIAIELKYGQNQVTKMQEHNIKKIRVAGGVACACWSLEEVKEVLNEIT